MRNKYHANKINTQYGLFDSQKEFRRFIELDHMEGSGEISNLRRQVKYELTPRITGEDGKVIERASHYVADFVYDKDGQTVVEDVKGYRGGAAYEIFKLKRKLMLHIHGIRIMEV